MPARHKTATMLLAARFPKLRATEPKAPPPAPEAQKVPAPPSHFGETEAQAWRDICSPICERRLWTDALALWAEGFASLLATARKPNDENAKPNRAQLRLYGNDIRQLIGDAPLPTEPNPFADL